MTTNTQPQRREPAKSRTEADANRSLANTLRPRATPEQERAQRERDDILRRLGVL